MTLIEDTRNQVGKHKNIERYCKLHGIELIRKKLDVGDYMIAEAEVKGNPRISVDTKQDLLELCKDVMSNDHRRFKAECVRGQEMGIQLIVLVEEFPPFGRVDLWEVPRWNSANQWHNYGDPMTLVDPAAFAKALDTMTERYGVKFRYCHRQQTPKVLIKYLRGELT